MGLKCCDWRRECEEGGTLGVVDDEGLQKEIEENQQEVECTVRFQMFG